jgi:hypothetical protein
MNIICLFPVTGLTTQEKTIRVMRNKSVSFAGIISFFII